MEASLLRDALERHRRCTRGALVHLMADRDGTYVTSGSPGGAHVMRTALPPLGVSLACSVSVDVAISVVPSRGELRLTADEHELTVRTARSRAVVPLVPEDVPLIPRPLPGAAALDAEDLAWLRETLPLVALQKTERDGQFGIVGTGDELSAGTFDEIHGAFAWRRSACRLSVGLGTGDAQLFLQMLKVADRVTVGMTEDQRLLVRSGGDRLALTPIPAVVQARDVVLAGCTPHWRVRVDDLVEAVQGVSVVASGKDADPISMLAHEGELVLRARSANGRAERRVPSRQLARQGAGIGCSLTLLQDVLQRLPRDEEIILMLLPGDDPSPRLVLRTRRATYVLLTASG